MAATGRVVLDPATVETLQELETRAAETEQAGQDNSGYVGAIRIVVKSAIKDRG